MTAAPKEQTEGPRLRKDRKGLEKLVNKAHGVSRQAGHEALAAKRRALVKKMNHYAIR